MKVGNLYVGAGKAFIQYTDDMLPTFGENYNAIHDLPMVQALVIKGEMEIAIISVDVVMLEIKQYLLEIASEILGIPDENVLIHATHVLATPHFKQWNSVDAWFEENAGSNVSREQALSYMERENRIVEAHSEAVAIACKEAKRTLQEAAFGVGVGKANITVNRVVETKDGWWQGVNPEGPVDQAVPVLRFDSRDGCPIALLFNCNVAPGCMEFSTVNGGRMISGDLAGAAEKFIDREMGDGVVSIYTTGFTGDQWQAMRARVDYLNKEKEQVIVDLNEAGFALVEALAVRLGEQVLKTALGIQTKRVIPSVHLDRYEFEYPGQIPSTGFGGGPVREGQYYDAGPQKAEIKILQIQNTAIIACGVELCYETAERIKRESPFENTFFMEFTTNGGGYMPEEIFYDRLSFQARKSRYAKGSAERFGNDIIDSLKKSYEKYLQTEWRQYEEIRI